MSITKNNSGGTFAIEHDRTTKMHPEHETAGRIITDTSDIRQNLFYILNTLFFTIIAFIAGYNLKGWQIQKSVNQSINAAEKYIQKADESQRLSTQLLEELKSYEIKSYEKNLTETATVSEVPVEQAAQLEIISTSGTTVHDPAFKKTTLSKTTPISKVVMPSRHDIPGVSIYHTVKEGEALSMLVERADMTAFLEKNPQITNPDLIYPGQRLIIKIPERNIQTGAYMNNYFIQPETRHNGGITYSLVRWINIPESDSLLGHIMKQPRQRITGSTVPYINLAEFANTMKEEIFNGDIVILSGKNKINRVKKTHTGIYFKTVRDHPFFTENQFSGVHRQNEADFYKNMDTLKDFLIKYLAHVNSVTEKKVFFHFMIFDRTIVQTDYLENSYFNKNGNKTKILIGLVYPTQKSERALIELQSSLTTCKVDTGEMVEINYENLKYFKN